MVNRNRCAILSRFIVMLVLLSAVRMALGASIEFLDGTRLECKVLAKDSEKITVEVVTADGPVKRTIPLAKIHRVTINDKTYNINERRVGSSVSASTVKPTAPADIGGEETTPRRTKAEVEALIQELGRQPPDWFESTPLKYPPSLDLSWPLESPGQGWNNQKNVGQYIWDIINPNPSKWREGVRLLHHLITLHQDEPAKRARDMESLGWMYHNLHQDYARAAFWWRQAGVEKSQSPPRVLVHLAECYWRLGNKPMAVEQLRRMRSVPHDAIKLWADMGEIRQAITLVNLALKGNKGPHHLTYLYAADACRVAGRYAQAIEYYEKVLELPNPEKEKGHLTRSQERAQASLEAIKLFELSDVRKVADGTYRSESIGYEGPVHVEVDVQKGQIQAVRIVEHREKQFYSALTDTPAKILARQSVKGIDATSGATITSEAIINATAKSLARGVK